MGIPVASGLRRVFSPKLPAFPMVNLMDSGVGKGFSSKLPTIPIGIPIELFFWLVA